MDKQPAVSVIVPVYKAENYLCHCVDSLLAQTFPDFEILLIDDGSPDHSGDICDEYARKDSRVRVFHKENEGVSSTRQCGIDNAKGEYTIHADPDDWVEPDMLDELYLFSFRNHGAFHEDCVNIIMKDLIKLMDPKYIEVTGIFTPRGGISIYPYCNYGRPNTKFEQLAEKRLFDHNQ